MVAAGSVLLERGENRPVVEEGDAAIIPLGHLEITEVSACGCTHTDVYSIFFSTRVLRVSRSSFKALVVLTNQVCAEIFSLLARPISSRS